MKVPNYIKIKIREFALHNRIASRADEVIRDWLVGEGIHSNHVIDSFIDCCENSCNPGEFIDRLEEKTEEGKEMMMRSNSDPLV